MKTTERGKKKGGGGGGEPPPSSPTQCLPRLKVQRAGIDAVALSRGFRPVVEDVPQVGVALGAQRLDAAHPVAQVVFGTYRLRAHRLPETGPAGAGLIFRVRDKQCIAATDAVIDAGLLLQVVCSRERRLGGLLPGDGVLLGGGLLPPVGGGLSEL